MKVGFFALLLALASLTTAEGAARNRYSYEEDKSVMLREILDSLEQLRHEVSNHEAEIRMYEEKFKNQEEILDSLRQQTADMLKSVKEALKNQASSIDSKIASQDTLAKDLKNHASDSSTVLSEYKRRIIELEKAIEGQNRNLDNLQQAMRSLTEVLSTKDVVADNASGASPSGKVYRVKAGDTLGEIAKANGTTVKRIKELNNLTRDQIIVGQKLQLPE